MITVIGDAELWLKIAKAPSSDWTNAQSMAHIIETTPATTKPESLILLRSSISQFA